MWKSCGKTQLLHSFRQIARNYTETAFSQNFHIRILGEITVFYAVLKWESKLWQSCLWFSLWNFWKNLYWRFYHVIKVIFPKRYFVGCSTFKHKGKNIASELFVDGKTYLPKSNGSNWCYISLFYPFTNLLSIPLGHV